MKLCMHVAAKTNNYVTAVALTLTTHSKMQAKNLCLYNLDGVFFFTKFHMSIMQPYKYISVGTSALIELMALILD